MIYLCMLHSNAVNVHCHFIIDLYEGISVNADAYLPTVQDAAGQSRIPGGCPAVPCLMGGPTYLPIGGLPT